MASFHTSVEQCPESNHEQMWAEPNSSRTMMCIPRHSLKSGFGSRSALRCSPASGSAGAAPPVCTLECAQLTGASALEIYAGWKLSCHYEHRRLSQVERTKTKNVSRCVFVFGLSFRVFSGEAGVHTFGKHEDNCRFPWMMMSHNERRLVIGVFCSCQDSSSQTLVLFQQLKR